MTKMKTKENTVTLDVIDACGWPAWCVYLNNYRIGGCKPWGGGRISKSFKIQIAHLQTALRNTDYKLVKRKKRSSK
jgi:hypothetical protein